MFLQHSTATNFILGPFNSLETLVLCGYSHAKREKHAFYLHFFSFPLAFQGQLGYSAQRPGLFFLRCSGQKAHTQPPVNSGRNEKGTKKSGG
jgi:hypothetical protein